MTRLLRAIRAIDLTDIAYVGGIVLLGVGLYQLSQPLAAIIVGGLLVAYGGAPLAATLLNSVRRR